MRSRIFWGVALIALALAALVAAPLPAVRSATQARSWAPQVMAEEAEEHVTKMGNVTAYRLDDLEWQPGPFPGSKCALLAGDAKTGMNHSYLKFADGTRIPPHWHTYDEYVTVVSGTILIGQGEKLDPQAARLFGPGAFVAIPPKSPHFAIAKGQVVLSVTRGGATDFHWVNPADDPTLGKKGATAPAATK
jgi:quercetin dioxygenase-like cupin family protein